ncbi:aldo/keto reductase [Acrocarpospora catenulata]|uniref:aldo/keto reductase n=1 Tax=Acrocarpospora catenulata TaxID=2836182 RepID=UPI0027E1865A|nr:aldo/keto reductase [Acrocarpospora catenulata]
MSSASGTALIRRALDSGVTLIDAYDPGGQAESLVGRALAGRDGVMISTGTGSWRVAGDCEASLRRLRMDRIDLYSVSPAVPGRSIEATMERAARLLESGKVAAIAVRGVTAGELRRAHAVCPVTALVAEYSLWHRTPEDGEIAAARELGLDVIACRPLGRGFLGGRITSPGQLRTGDRRRADRRFTSARLAAALPRLRAAQRVAADLDIGISRLALAWLRAQGEHIVPVPSTRDPIHLEMNLSAAKVRLTPGHLRRLDEAFPPGNPSGERAGAPPSGRGAG